MKRHKKLIPLSHEHHRALSLAFALRNTPHDPETQALLFKERSILLDHFTEEERLLNHLKVAFDNDILLKQFHAEHQQLRAMLNSSLTAQDYPVLGQLLHDHVRFEERLLFPALELHGLEEKECENE